MDLKAEYLRLLKLSLIDGLGYELYRGPPRMSGSRRDVNTLPLDQIEVRLEGRDWPSNGMTMIGLRRLDNIERCIEDVVASGVPGDLIETGVWRGGAAIFMSALLRLLGAGDRGVWAADSFKGLPPPDPNTYPADAGSQLHEKDFLAVSLERVRANFERYGVLDDRVRFVEGWFRDTLPALADRNWALIRLDGDLYESTIVALESLYPGLSEGGYVIVDDYGISDQCRQAVEDYRRDQGIDDPLQEADWSGVFWKKSASGPRHGD